VSGISRHRFEGNRAAVTVWDIQVEAKLRRPRGTTLAVPVLILCLSLRAVKENLGSTIRLDKHLVLRNIEVGTLRSTPAKRKNFSRFAYEQTGFALGQVSTFRSR
jgi:hypothetical protein